MSQTTQFRKLEDLADDDLRRMLPRLSPENFEANTQLADEIDKLAKQKGATMAQVGLAWVRQHSGRNGLPTVVPIPGATTSERILENTKEVTLSKEELAAIDSILERIEVKGGRYPDFLAAFSEG